MVTDKRAKILVAALREEANMIQDETAKERFLDLADMCRISDVPERQATRLFNDGATVAEMAALTDRSENSIVKWIRRKQRTK